MGEVADKMINGEYCTWCGVALEPGEIVYTQSEQVKVIMPGDGTPFGTPVICSDCKE